MKFEENRVYTAMFGDTESGDTYTGDVILDQKQLWLVPRWLEDSKQSKRLPERKICLEDHPYQVHFGEWCGDLTVNEPIPIAALCDADRSITIGGFLVVVDALNNVDATEE